MISKFDFEEMMEQAKAIDTGVDEIRQKLINCDIGDGDATEALALLDGDLSDVEGKLDSIYNDLVQEINFVEERNSEVRTFIADLNSKIDRLEVMSRDSKSPNSYLETPLSGRGYHSRYKS